MSHRQNFWQHDAVSAMVYSLAQAHVNPQQPELQPPYNDLTAFVLRQQGQMPDYLRPLMLAATLGFDLQGLLRTGRLFHHGSPTGRDGQMAAWRCSKLGFSRDLIRYYESLATLALYSRPSADAGSNCTSNADAPSEMAVPGVVSSPVGETACEIAVVGSGPGGSITACLLAEAGRNVLLLEEGPYYSLESCEPFSTGEMLQRYRNGGQTVAFGRNKIAYVEGRCVGGGSEINSGLYHRTPPEILEAWRKEYLVEASSAEELRPHFEACERDLSVSLLPGPAPAASSKLHEGATRLGWKSLEVPRWYRYDSKDGRGIRQSMTNTFVPRFLKAGGQLLPRTRAERIRQEGGKWVLQAYHPKSGPLRITSETLFLCAGAVQTPALLRRSGIKRNIGNSLRLHPTVKLVAKYPEPVNSADMGVPVHQVKEFAPRLSFGCSISTPAYLALGMVGQPNGMRDFSQTWPHMANYYAMITGEGYGTVRAVPGFRDPVVRHHLTENDRRDLADGMRKLSEILFSSGAVTLYPGGAFSDKGLSRDDLGRLPEMLPDGQANLMTIHLFSSCPMGEDKTKCATDSFGRVHGFRNLFVADASLLCTAPGVNPQGSIMALARRNALNLLARSK